MLEYLARFWSISSIFTGLFVGVLVGLGRLVVMIQSPAGPGQSIDTVIVQNRVCKLFRYFLTVLLYGTVTSTFRLSKLIGGLGGLEGDNGGGW